MRREYTLAQINLCNNDNWPPFLKEVYLPIIPPGQNRAWPTLQGGTGRTEKWEIHKNKGSLRIFGVTHSTYYEFFYAIRKTQSILWAELEEFLSLLMKDYIGDIDCPNTVLFGMERTKKSTPLLWTYQCCLNMHQTHAASHAFFFVVVVPTRQQNISYLEDKDRIA